MSTAYPRADAQHKPRWFKKPSSQMLCCVCNQPATHRVFVQVNWFRGDDEGPFKACKAHKEEAQALLDSRSGK